MKSLTKVLLAAVLLAGTSYAFADKPSVAKVSSGNVVQDRHLSGFSAIDASGSFDVYITQGGGESVKVDAPADMQQQIITEVEGGTLKVHDKHGSWSWGGWGGHKKVAVYVTINQVNSIGITGSGDVYFKEGIRSSRLRLAVSGSGDVLGKVDAKSLECDISGSGDMKLAGHAENASISVSGSGDFTAHDLVTSNTSVNVSGSGDASVNVNNNLEASVSGSGDVSYSGNPRHIVKSKSGSGDISGH